jgi:hypothetical protein
MRQNFVLGDNFVILAIKKRNKDKRLVEYLICLTMKNRESVLKILNANKFLKIPKRLDNLGTGDETGIYYFEPKCEIFDRIWASENAKYPSIVKRL